MASSRFARRFQDQQFGNTKHRHKPVPRRFIDPVWLALSLISNEVLCVGLSHRLDCSDIYLICFARSTYKANDSTGKAPRCPVFFFAASVSF